MTDDQLDSDARVEASYADPADCPKCGEWRDNTHADCSACGYDPDWDAADDLYEAIGEDAFDRLTRGDESLERDLHGVLVRVHNLGYRAGLQAGGQLVADAVADRIGPATVVVDS